MQVLGLVFIAFGVIMSVRQRRYLSMWRSAQPISSPLASALAQLVGTAGGIYLSLELLFSFLKLPQEWWSSAAFMVEPLAVLSLALAIVQPFAIRLWRNLRRN